MAEQSIAPKTYESCGRECSSRALLLACAQSL